MIESQGLQFAYPGGAVLRFPDLHCGPQGEWLILGESGSGKTTMLQLLAGLRKPTAGKVMLNGTDLHGLSGSRLDRFRGKYIGLVFQTPHFLQALNIRQNIALAQQLAGKSVDYAQVDAMLDRLGIGHRAHARPLQCSQGEQQRASIARALINRPALLLADEPTSALDDRHCREVLDLLAEQSRASQAALIIVTHDQRLKDRISNTLTLSAHA